MLPHDADDRKTGQSGSYPPPTENRVNEIAPVSIAARIPAFWHQRTRLWFAQFESAIGAQKKSDLEKFNLAIAQLDQGAMLEVSDIVLDPPTSRLYETLKERLLSTYEESEEQQLHKLLHETELGDNKPSQLLRRMNELNRGKIPETTLKMMWLGHLPNSTQAILTISKEEDLHTLAKMADKIAGRPTQINALQSNSTEQSIARQNEVITRLENQVQRLTRQLAERSNGDDTRKRKGADGRACYYHWKFGPGANKCQPPCSFTSERRTEN